MKDKRESLIEAAIDLFSREGFWNIPTSRIAKHAGVATGTLFNYFPTKEALIDAVYALIKAEVMDEIATAFDPAADLEAQARTSWHRYVAWGLAHPVRYRLMNQLRLSEFVTASTRRAIEARSQTFLDPFERAIREGRLRDLPASYVLESMTGQMNAMVQSLSERPTPTVVNDPVIEQGFLAFWSGVVVR